MERISFFLLRDLRGDAALYFLLACYLVLNVGFNKELDKDRVDFGVIDLVDFGVISLLKAFFSCWIFFSLTLP